MTESETRCVEVHQFFEGLPLVGCFQIGEYELFIEKLDETWAIEIDFLCTAERHARDEWPDDLVDGDGGKHESPHERGDFFGDAWVALENDDEAKRDACLGNEAQGDGVAQAF